MNIAIYPHVSGGLKVFSAGEMKYPHIFIFGVIFLAYKVLIFGIKVAWKGIKFYSVRNELRPAAPCGEKL